MNNKLIEIIKIIFTLIAIISALITIVLLIIKMIGHSPTEITILLSLVSFLIALQIIILTVLFQVKGDIGGLKEFRRQTVSEIREIKKRIISSP